MISVYEKRQAELERLRQLRPLEEDDFPDIHGVLYSDQIQHLCTSVPAHQALLTPFDPEKLHPAGYKLRVGNEYYLGGDIYYLPTYPGAPEAARRQRIIIPPFDVAIIKTAETLCLPRFVIARWNILVRQAYSGLLWVGGPQVDPGYTGHLFCPLYNLSHRDVELDEWEDIALIDFVKTTICPYRHTTERGKAIRWELQDKAILDDYVKNRLQSALVTEAKTRLRQIDDRMANLEKNVTSDVRRIDDRLTVFTGFMIAALAVIPAILAILLPSREAATFAGSIWAPIAIGFSTFAFASALLRWLFERGVSSPSPALAAAAGAAAIVALGLTGYLTYQFNAELVKAEERRESFVEDVRSDIERLERQVLDLEGDKGRTPLEEEPDDVPAER